MITPNLTVKVLLIVIFFHPSYTFNRLDDNILCYLDYIENEKKNLIIYKSNFSILHIKY